MRSRPRLAISGAVIALWTIIYALYSVAYPSAGAFPRDIAASRTMAAADQLGASGAPIDLFTGRFSANGAGESPGEQEDLGAAPSTLPPATTPASEPPPAAGGGNPPAPCSVAAQADAVRDAQVAVEGLTGQPLGADGGAVVEALAGCKDPVNTALSLLGPINQLLTDAGFTEPIPLPDLPGLPAFVIPEPIAAPLRSTVFDACGQVLRQIYTVGTVAPVLRIEFEDVVAVANYVSTACSAFAPAPQGAA